MAGKEYTTAPILVNADGHPIPQYLDITDTTDSPQGTFKPLTQLQAERPDVQNVQLTGRNVEVINVFNGYAITDTEEHSVILETVKHKRIYLISTNTHDTPVRLDIRFNSGSTSRIWDGEDWITPVVSIPTATFDNRYLINTYLPFLNHIAARKMWVVAKANTAPTMGSLTVEMLGVVN